MRTTPGPEQSFRTGRNTKACARLRQASAKARSGLNSAADGSGRQVRQSGAWRLKRSQTTATPLRIMAQLTSTPSGGQQMAVTRYLRR
jgi:hypothetical protein